MPQYQEPAGVIHSVLKTDAGDAFHKELAGKNGRLPQPSADARRELVDARSKNIPATGSNLHQAFRPAFWDSKLYGEPFGNFHRCRMPASAKANGPSNKDRLPYQKRIDSAQVGDLARLEQTMRAVVNRRATVHAPDKVQLLTAFAKALGKRRAEVKDTVRLEQFQQAWRQFDVALSHAQAEAIFNKYGQNVSGRMPVMVFVNAFLAGAPRAAVRCNAGIMRGPLSPQKQHKQELAGNVKIMYPHCKHGVFAPTDWDPSQLERSAALPDKSMELDFVHGYEGRSTLSSNVHYSADGRVVYHIAAVGIVYCRSTHRQEFFIGHNDDILCLAMHPDKLTVASGQVAALETSDCQNGTRRADPCVLVWSTETLKEQQRLFHGRGMRGVSCVDFSSSGKTLVSICTDDSHTMFVWSWQRGQCLLSRKTRAGAAPDVCGVCWSPYTADELCTFGINHVFFWKLVRKPEKESLKTGEKLGAQLEAGQWGKVSPHTAFCCCWMPSGALLTGSDDGSLVTWKHWKCVDKVNAHARGPTVQRADGGNSFNGIRAIRLISNDREIVTCGGDGFVKIFQVTASGDLGVSLRSIPLRQQDAEAGVPMPLPRSLAIDDQGFMLAGTGSCDIWQVSPDGTAETIVFGHRADVIGLAMNPKPAYSHIFATCSDSCKVAVWSLATKKIVKVVTVAERARCLAFAPNGEHLAVGMHSGALAIMGFHPTVQEVAISVPCSDAITVLSYSPDGNYIAAGSRDQTVTVVDTKKQLSMKLSGHSSTIRSIDWSSDSQYVMSTDQACEVVCFDVHTCQVSKESHRDQRWHSWTSVLGFPVMGIWPLYADGTDVNAVDRSPDGRYLLTADDSGMVKMFASPCIVKSAGHYVFRGHSSHVACVRWSACGKYAVSIGGKDHGVFVWKIANLQAAERPRPQAQPPWALHI